MTELSEKDLKELEPYVKEFQRRFKKLIMEMLIEFVRDETIKFIKKELKE